MIPPRGFKSEVYPLRHRLEYAFGLSAITGTMNSAYATLVMSSTDTDVLTSTIQVNPHHTGYEDDAGPLVRQMSILDKINIAIRFNMTSYCLPKNETSSGAWSGDGLQHIKLLWRPVFFSFDQKLLAADDDTGVTVAAILGLTVDASNEDVVPITTSKLPVLGVSDQSQPISTVNAVQVKEDYNMTTDLTMEDHPWSEDLFQDAMRRYTIKGALKACVGRTRHVHLTANQPYKSYYLSKFVPRAIRRVMPYTHMGIQVYMPTFSDIDQDFIATNGTPSVPHVGVKIICNYHEWNAEHDQDMAP